MKLHCRIALATASATTTHAVFHRPLHTSSQDLSKLNLGGFTSKLLNRRWSFPNPDTKIQQIVFRKGEDAYNNTFPLLGDGMGMQRDDQGSSFYIVRDDLLHPLINGNKARKLDALLPLLEQQSVTHVVTCGGCQSAHAAAVGVLCAERGIKSHLLLRGEQPEILTGYNLVSTMYGNVTYVPRSHYAHREKMLKNHANLVASENGFVVGCDEIIEDSFSNQISGSPTIVNVDDCRVEICPTKVAIVNEGAGDAAAFLGIFRLVDYLAQKHVLGNQRVKFVVDAGTGTTSVGLQLAALCLGLPWEVTAVMLADTIDGYKRQEARLISDFKRQFGFDYTNHELTGAADGGMVNWVERSHPRKFGNILEGEVKVCQRIAQQTGVLVDPMYTLAAWETATRLCRHEAEQGVKVVMLHTGGTLGMFGLAQRYKSYFSELQDGISC